MLSALAIGTTLWRGRRRRSAYAWGGGALAAGIVCWVQPLGEQFGEEAVCRTCLGLVGVPLRGHLGVILATAAAFVLWGLVAAWIVLKLGAFRIPLPETITLLELAGRALAAVLVLAVYVMPAVALGRAARVIAPGFRYPFAAGVLAWFVAFFGSAAFSLSGAEQAILRFLAPPAS